jgi:hypothetical protein
MSRLFLEDSILVTEMTLVLSHMRGTISKITPKSLMLCTMQRICEQQLYTWPRWWIVQQKTIYEKTNKQEKIQENNKYLRSVPKPAKSALEKPIRWSEEEAEYQIPNSEVCLRYLNILWTIPFPWGNLTYILKWTRHTSLLAQTRPHNYRRAISPWNRVRQ